jgi:hypothetical protein
LILFNGIAWTHVKNFIYFNLSFIFTSKILLNKVNHRNIIFTSKI